MPSQADVKQISAGKVSPKRRFDMRDWRYITEYVRDEHATRKRKRKDRERHWAEIDRQISMEPDLKFKKLPDGRPDVNKLWMAEMETPFQAQALEVLTADARRMMFAEHWFGANAEMTDDYLEGVDYKSIILGDKAEVPSQIDQDNINKLVEGYLVHLFRQNDLPGRVDKVNAEAFKYGMGVGRARMETKNVYIHEAMGVRKETQRIPVLVPCSIKHLYLDDSMPSMHSAQVLGPGHIAEDYIRYENLVVAANKGSIDPDDIDGGWMPANLSKVVAKDDGYVQVLEYEGDLVVPRKSTSSLVIPGAIATVVVGGEEPGGGVTSGVIRFRFRKMPYSSYLLFPYHYEGADCTYPTSPLEKGRPIQMAATDSLNRWMDSGALKNQPPVGYDKNDTYFATKGGPQIFPGAQWGTIEPVQVYEQIGGDPAAMVEAFRTFVNLYAELTGVLPARLGAQTVSHTTAFAKDAELTRGAVRTVDYVNASGEGPLTRWLYMAYDMGRNSIKSRQQVSFYIKAYGGFVQVTKDQLPERSEFEWFGSGGPSEEAQKNQMMLQSMNTAIQIDNLAAQQKAQGIEGEIDYKAAVREVLRRGGWSDLDIITKNTAAALPTPMGQPNPGLQSVALQQLGLGAQAA